MGWIPLLQWRVTTKVLLMEWKRRRIVDGATEVVQQLLRSLWTPHWQKKVGRSMVPRGKRPVSTGKCQQEVDAGVVTRPLISPEHLHPNVLLPYLCFPNSQILVFLPSLTLGTSSIRQLNSSFDVDRRDSPAATFEVCAVEFTPGFTS